MTDAGPLDVPYPRAVARFPTLRQSLLSSFDNCGLSAFFDADYRRGWSSAPQARGQVFHRFAGACLKQMAAIGEETIPVDAALGVLRDILRQDDADRVCRKCGALDLEPGIDLERGTRRCAACGQEAETEIVNVPLSVVKDLYWCAIKWANDNAWNIGELVDIEQRLRAVVQYPNRLTGGMVPRELTGQLDALFVEGNAAEHAVVMDWKDTWSLPPEPRKDEEEARDSISPDGYFQQRFYAWLVFKNYPSVWRVTLREFYVRYSQPREATLTRDQEPEIEAELAALAERFDRAWDEALAMKPSVMRKRPPFRPTPGKHCSFCIRPSGCPIPRFGREEGRITDAARAEEVAAQLQVGEQVVKKARAALRAYADTHGSVPVKDAKGKRALGYVEVVRVERPSLEEVERVLAIDPQADVTKLYRKRRSTRFQAHVPEGEVAFDDGALQAALEASIEQAAAEMPAPGGPSDNVADLHSTASVPSDTGTSFTPPDQEALS